MSEDYVALDPDAVRAAGRGTAGTAREWAQWAAQVQGSLRDAAAQSQEPVVSAAFEEHLSTWNLRINALATDADALGTNAVSGANVMANADSTSTAVLGGQATTEHTTTTHLRRPIAV
jgi:hypothetical protein